MSWFGKPAVPAEITTEDARRQASLLHAHADLLVKIADASDAKQNALRSAVGALDAALADVLELL